MLSRPSLSRSEIGQHHSRHALFVDISTGSIILGALLKGLR
jgi:hypothetical protein